MRQAPRGILSVAVVLGLAASGPALGQTVVVQQPSRTPAVLPAAPRIVPGRTTLIRPYASPNVDVSPSGGTTVVQPHVGQSVTVVPAGH